MENKNYVFIAKSLDGYIADINGGIDWLENTVPNPAGKDLGYVDFIHKIDAIIMGRTTFEKVLSFNIPWPYHLPVFVASHTLKKIPVGYTEHVELVKGAPNEIVTQLNKQGYHKLYIDGGNTVQGFLKEDLIDEMILTTLPILIGGGTPLFSELPNPMLFNHVKSEVFLNAITQDTYTRKR
ncbi:dihydrofolate reductase family protein [Saccharicrinis sp. GN24d3]|uniref:dihydrofolate reductase family protein n=1 Tax=Saccharicrinis sp. GN24d3 TaxID=3458416 RepID=UPI00403606B5